jgi:hypothetical protein
MTFHRIVAVLTLAAVPVLAGPAAAQVCGNSIVEPPEECDPSGSISCPPGSPAGAFQACGADCTCPVAEPLDHFQCYEGRPHQLTRVRDVTLVDQFGTQIVDVFGPTDLCAPANKNDEDPTAPDHPAHLASYAIKGHGHFTPVKDQLVVNQFGSVTVDVTKPRSLLVPTAKSLVGPPSPLGAFIDHFACYKVRTRDDDSDDDDSDHNKRGRRGRDEDDEEDEDDSNVTATVETQFETVEVDVRRPRELCAPADKNGENPGAESHPDHLLCYEIKNRQKFEDRDTFLNNQFGDQSFEVKKRGLLCVPSLKNPGTTTTTVPTTTTTIQTTTTTTAPTTTTTAPTTTTTIGTTTTSTTATTTTTTTTIYGSPSRAFLFPARDLLE